MTGEPRGRGSVLLVAASNRRRGAEVFTEHLAEGLRDRGWPVDAVSLTGVPGGASVSLRPLSGALPGSIGRFDLAVFRSLRSLIRRERPGVVVAMGGPTLRYAVASNLPRVSALVYFSVGEPRYWMRSSISRSLNRAMLRRVDRVVAVCNATADQLRQFSPEVADRITVSYTGVARELFELEGGDARSDGPMRVGVIGSLSHEKDPRLALEACARVEGVELRFIGDGPLRSDLEVAAEALGMAQRVSFTGEIDDIGPELRSLDLLLLTSRTEGLPGVILEAAASGVPAVGVDVGGVGEAIQDEVTGRVVERDVRIVSDALADLRDDRVTLRAMGSAARERALEVFSLEDSVARFSGLIEKAMS